MCTDVITASGRQLIDHLAAGAAGHEGLDHRDQPGPVELGDRLTALLEGGHRAGIAQIEPEQHLRAFEARLDRPLYVITGVPVIDLERCTLQAAAVHRREDELVLQRTEQKEVFGDVGGREQSIDTRPGQCGQQALEQLGAIGHGRGFAAGTERTARRVIAGHDHQLAVLTEQ